MKTIAPILFALLFIVSCKNAIKDEVVTEKETPETKVEEIIEPIHAKANKNTTVSSKEDLIGYWVGWFMPDQERDYEDYVITGEHLVWKKENKITLSIDTIRNDSVIGHSIVAGNFRSFHGALKIEGRFYTINVKEPGDDKYDGTFTFSIEKNMDTLRGTWAAYKKIQTPKRKYKLNKRLFAYKPDVKLRNNFVDWLKSKTRKDEYIEGLIEDVGAYFATTQKVTELNPSVDTLTQKDVEKLTKADIYVLRNSIYAKHGYSFKKRALRVFFDSHDWYMPVHVNIKSELTDLEKKNIKLLLRYEKYAEEYYDEFGRG